MFLECPNCRASISLIRSLRTTAWGSFRCRACGSVLGISFARRMLAAGIWIAGLLFAMEVLRLYTWGRLASYGLMAVMFAVLLCLCEKIILLDRRAFTCKQCGYDLQGLPEARCPECGADFDPTERERIVARIASPTPRPKHRRIAALVVVLLALAVALGVVLWHRTAGTPTTRSAALATQPASSTSQNAN